MPRIARIAPGGMIFHVLNRAVARLPLFDNEDDYAAFERVLEEALDKHPTRLLAYAVMPNHWHLLLWPRADGELTAFTRWLTHTHTMRWHAHHHTEGTGHLYQGRFKSFPVQSDEHFYAVTRYVEQNPVRAGLAERADLWRWSSAWRRRHGDDAQQAVLAGWPLARPDDWSRTLSRPQPPGEVEAIQRCVRKGAPYGAGRWVKQSAVRLGLEQSLRPRGRPKK
jgi:putative transposase